MKLALNEKYIVDNKGNRTGIVLDIDEYQRILELLEDIEDIKYIREHKNDERISLDDFIVQLEKENLV